VNNLSFDEKESALKYLSDKNPMYAVLALEVRNPESGYFSKVLRTPEIVSSMEPSVWWKSAAGPTVPDSLLTLINNIFVMPSSSAGIERSFSTLGNIMTPVRNRLGLEKASMLCCIHNQLKLEQETFSRKRKRHHYESDSPS
jgi:hypothetical protein